MIYRAENLDLYEYILNISDNILPSKALCQNLVKNLKEEYKLLGLIELLPYRHSYGTNFNEKFKTLSELIEHLALQLEYKINNSQLNLYILYVISCKNMFEIDSESLIENEKILSHIPNENIEIYLWFNILASILHTYSSVYFDVNKLRQYLNLAKEYNHFGDVAKEVQNIINMGSL